MQLIYVRDNIDPEWHRIDADVTPIQRQALCTYKAQVASREESPWTQVWKRAIDPPGKYCAKCDNLASRLTGTVMTTTPKVEVSLLFGDDLNKLLGDL